VRNTIIKRISCCAACLLAFGIIIAFWGDTIISVENNIFRGTFYFLILLIPFAITGVPFKMIDQTYCGTVKKIDIISMVDNKSSALPAREHLYYKNTVCLTIQKQNGKEVTKKVFSCDAKTNSGIELYKVGDTVFHLYGTKYVVIIPKMSDSQCQCVICGHKNDKNLTLCQKCCYTLVGENIVITK